MGNFFNSKKLTELSPKYADYMHNSELDPVTNFMKGLPTNALTSKDALKNYAKNVANGYIQDIENAAVTSIDGIIKQAADIGALKNTMLDTFDDQVDWMRNLMMDIMKDLCEDVVSRFTNAVSEIIDLKFLKDIPTLALEYVKKCPQPDAIPNLEEKDEKDKEKKDEEGKDKNNLEDESINAANKTGVETVDGINYIVLEGESEFDISEVIKRGSKGAKVKKIQKFLGFNEAGQDGDFEGNTEDAVKAWQAKNGLPATGVVDKQTWDKMFPSNLNNNVTINADNDTAAAKQNNLVYPGKYIQLGSKGDLVREIQKVVGVNPNGNFDKTTREAVRVWQKANGLKADGVVGELTWEAMFGKPTATPTSTTSATPTSTTSATPTSTEESPILSVDDPNANKSWNEYMDSLPVSNETSNKEIQDDRINRNNIPHVVNYDTCFSKGNLLSIQFQNDINTLNNCYIEGKDVDANISTILAQGQVLLKGLIKIKKECPAIKPFRDIYINLKDEKIITKEEYNKYYQEDSDYTSKKIQEYDKEYLEKNIDKISNIFISLFEKVINSDYDSDKKEYRKHKTNYDDAFIFYFANSFLGDISDEFYIYGSKMESQIDICENKMNNKIKK